MEKEKINDMNYLYISGAVILFVIVLKEFYSAGKILGKLTYDLLS